ncbi:MAG: sortase [Anaerolineales bacterium]|nr:sortase [Anaerolineales bacterium]
MTSQVAAVPIAEEPIAAVGGALPAAPVQGATLHKQADGRTLPNRLLIPSIGVDTPVVELGWSTKKNAAGAVFSEWDVAEYAAGWHKNSSIPGENGNVVMSGHNNILGSVFRELDQLKRGDQISVVAGDAEFAYAVEEVLIVPEKYASQKQRRDNARYIESTDDTRLTLVSCWPRDDNTHRIVVIARLRSQRVTPAAATQGSSTHQETQPFLMGAPPKSLLCALREKEYRHQQRVFVIVVVITLA